jgi:hypothetical protein
MLEEAVARGGIQPPILGFSVRLGTSLVAENLAKSDASVGFRQTAGSNRGRDLVLINGYRLRHSGAGACSEDARARVVPAFYVTRTYVATSD